MTTTMTITDPDWTMAGMIDGWRNEESEAVATDAANCQYAWLILNTNRRLREQNLSGWSFTDGGFTGPATNRSNTPDMVMGLITESIDYVIENLGEIRKEAEQG